MREGPPSGLIADLERLGLATAAELQAARRHVSRLAKDLPRYESVWIDALLQARTITPFQAFQWNAGGRERLRLRPYVLCQPLAACDYLPCYRARHCQSREIVRLAIIAQEPAWATESPGTGPIFGATAPTSGEGVGRKLGPVPFASLRGQIEGLVAASARLPEEFLAPLRAVGVDGGRLWVASPWTEGLTAAQWLIHHGRLAPPMVLEIGRAMAAGLAALEHAGLCHGDVSTSSLLLTAQGAIVLTQPGLRGIVRPEEGYPHADLRPEAYATLAPERLAAGTPPNTASDLYGWGCVCWHLLCGRGPIAGGDSLGTLRAAHAGTIGDVRRLALDVPSELAAAIARCVARQPVERPKSAAELVEMLGAAGRRSRQVLARSLARSAHAAFTTPPQAAVRVPRPSMGRLTAAATALMLVVAVAWPWWSRTGRFLATGPKEVGWVDGYRRAAVVGEPHQNQIPSHGGARSTRPTLQSPGATAGLPSSAVITVEQASRGTHTHGHRDPAVTPALFEAKPADILLAGDRPVRCESLSLQAGQGIRGPQDKRVTMLVPHDGWLLRAEDLRFENLDFRWDGDAEPLSAAEVPPALVRLAAWRAEFRGCTFSTPRGGALTAAAILWTPPGDRRHESLTLPSGRLHMAHCVFERVGAGIDCRTAMVSAAGGALNLQLENTLHLGTGPLVRLDHCPAADEPLHLVLQQVTLRQSGPLLECHVAAAGHQGGELAFQAADCVFAPAADAPLLRFCAAQSPQAVLGSVKWTGQGSLVSPQTPIAAWQSADGQTHELDDEALSIAGLVRSSVEFAGPAVGPTAGSRASRWQAPLQSPDPPGIDVRLLPAGETSPQPR